MRSRLIVALCACLAWLMVAVPSVAQAAPPVSGSGSVTQLTFATTDARTADGVKFFHFTETDRLTGTFVGDTTLSGECIQRVTGPILCRATEIFTGTVLGRSGTVTFLDLISIDQITGAVLGRFTILGGTGELTGIHGVGTFQAQGNAGTYSVTIVLAT
jgi:hypothetical protein